MNAVAEVRPDVPAVAASSPAPRSAAAQRLVPSEFWTFRLGGEEYGIDYLRVQETRS